MFDAFLMGDAGVDRVAAIGPDEAVEAVAGAEVRTIAGAVLEDTGWKVGRDADNRVPRYRSAMI